MADPQSAAPVFKTKQAVTRKHLKRDQAAARKARGLANVGDSLKDRQVCMLSLNLSKDQLLSTLLYPQQKLKEEKEAKRATLDSRHQFLFSTVATKLRIPENEVEDFILEGTQVK